MFTRIVVGVDCCEGGRDALTLAMQLQSAGGGELVAVHACAPGPLLRGDVVTRVEAQMARVGATGRAQAVADRSPAHTLRMAAEREGARADRHRVLHLAGAERILSGDDTAATLHRAPGAVAVAVAPRGFARMPGMLQHIGVGLDGSTKSSLALALACRLAHQTGARVRATTVVPVRMARWPKPAMDPGWSGHEEAARQLDERLLTGVAVGLDVDVTPEVVVGTAWKELASRSAGPRPPRRGRQRMRNCAPAAPREHVDEARASRRVSAAGGPAGGAQHGPRAQDRDAGASGGGHRGTLARRARAGHRGACPHRRARSPARLTGVGAPWCGVRVGS